MNKILEMVKLLCEYEGGEYETELYPVIESKFKRLELLESYLDKWEEQLKIDGVNSKGMVLNDIQYLINER